MKPVLIEERVTVIKWTVEPLLPPGLTIDSRGVISGSPTIAAPPVAVTVVAESTGGKSKQFVMPPIEIQLNEDDIKLEMDALVSKFDPCPFVVRAPNNEDDMSAILKVRTDAKLCIVLRDVAQSQCSQFV
jgi:hypothetical protein